MSGEDRPSARPRAALLRQRRARLERRTSGMPLSQRLDPLFARLLGGLASILLFLFAGAVLGAWRLGWFEPQVLRKVPDERRLTNVRDHLDRRPLLAATLHGGRLYLSQSGGEIHRFDPATGLWSSRRPFAGHPAALGDLVDLRSGCGTDPQSRRPACAEPGNLWGLSRGGGLARRTVSGDWSVVFGESAFEGAGGERPSTDDLTAAALSADGRWLLVGSREDGVGLYDREIRTWVPVHRKEQSALPSLEVSHLRWWSDRFWIGGPRGLGFLVPAEEGPQGGAVAGLDGTVLDLDAGDVLWTLGSRPCDNDSGQSCLRLARLTGPEGPELLVDERRRYSRLNLESVRFAHLQTSSPAPQGALQTSPPAPQGALQTSPPAPRVASEDAVLVLAGRAGLFTYDVRSHTWNRQLSRPVTAAWPSPEGDLYVGFAGGALLLRGGKVFYEWHLPDQRIRRLLPGIGAEVLALTSEGHVWSLPARDEAWQAFTATSTGYDPAVFFDALPLDDKVLFRASGGVLVHDVAARSYRDLGRVQVPDWLLDQRTRLMPSGDTLFALPPADAASQRILATDPAALLASHFDEVGSVPAPIRSAGDWKGQGLGVIARDGSAHLALRRGIRPLIGEPATDLGALEWRDARFAGGELAVATEQGLRLYKLAERSWEGWRLEGMLLRRLAWAGGELRALTAGGELVRANPNDPYLIGGSAAWKVSDTGLKDVLEAEGQIYLAGDGWVQRYDPARRRQTGEWDLGRRAGPERLIGAVGRGDQAEPLTWDGRRVLLGDRDLDPDAGAVVSVSTGNRFLWTVRDLGGRRYLKGHLRDRPGDEDATRCFFRHATAGSVRPVDVAPVRAGWTAVATTGGLKLYSRSARSWYDVDEGRERLLPDGGRLHALASGHLALDSTGAAGRGQLRFVSAAALEEPPSCQDTPRLSAAPEHTLDVLAVAFGPSTGAGPAAPPGGPGGTSAVAWIAADGSVATWEAGAPAPLLASPETAPRPRELRRVFRFGGADRVYFTTATALYRYSLASHGWTHVFQAGGNTADINLEQGPGPRILTVTDGSGAVSVVDLDAADGPAIGRVLKPRDERPGRFGAPPGALLDVQRQGAFWGFLLPDRLRIYDPAAHRWEPDVVFPGPPDSTLELFTVHGKFVAVKEEGRELWIQQGLPGGATRFALYEPGDEASRAIDEQSTLWRLRPDGSVEKCVARDADYACVPVSRAAWLLEPDRVREAYSASGWTFFVGRDGTRAYDQAARSEASLPAEVAALTGVAQAVRAGGLWLVAEDGRLFRGNRNRWRKVSGPAVRRLVVAEGGAVWAETRAGSWRRWAPDGFVDPAAGTDLRLLPVVEDQPVTAIGVEGSLYRHRAGAFAFVGRVPASTDPAEVKALVGLGPSGAWLHVGRELVRLYGPLPAAEDDPRPAAGARFDLGEGDSRLTTWKAVEDDRVLLRLSSGRGFELSRDRGRFSLASRSIAVRSSHEAFDLWPVHRRQVVPRPDGRTAFDPVLRLEVERTDTGAGRLTAVRPSGSDQLTALGSETEMRPRQALDAGWLKWDRAGRVFVVRTASGPLRLTPEEFVDETTGRLLFEGVRAVLAENDRLHAATPAGVWTVPRTPSGLSLDFGQRHVTFRPIALEDPVQAAHGRFLTPSASVKVDTGDREPGAYREHRVRIGRNVVLREDTRRRTVGGDITTSGGTLSAFGDRGLRWDERRGLAYRRGRRLPTLLTAAGIHGVDVERTDFDLGPLGQAHRSGRLGATAAGDLLFEDGGSRYLRMSPQSGGWRPAPAGASDGSPVADGERTWRRRGGRVAVSLDADPYGFALASGAALGFTSDLLVAAVAHRGDLFLMSEAYLEIGSEDRVVTSGAGRRKPPAAVRRLESVASDPAAPPELHLWNDAGVFLWREDSESFRLLPSDEDPLRSRWLVRGPRWRFRKSGGQVVKQLSVTDPLTSKTSWKRFTLSRRGFSFDQVTAVGAFDGQLLVHTAAGLQVYRAAETSTGGTGLGDIRTFYDLGRDLTGTSNVIARLGIPAGEPHRFVVLYPSGCLESRDDGTLARCSSPASLKERWLGESSLWRWTEKRGQVRGFYKNFAGRLTATRATLRDGRLPHDDLLQVLGCDSDGVGLWRNGWISFHPEGGLALEGARHRDDLAASNPRELHCRKSDYPVKQGRVQAGLYASADSGGRWWRWEGGRWNPLGNPELIGALKRPPLGFWGRLRLVRTSGSPELVFQYRHRDGAWTDLPWLDGRVALDSVKDLQVLGGLHWAVTPAGLAAFERGAQGDLHLDPADLTLVREPPEGERPCSITDFETSDDRAVVRCGHDSTKVFEGRLAAGVDRDVFRPAPEADPFVERVLVSGEATPFWDWRLAGRSGGRPGTLEARLHGEPHSLVDGRFDFDDLTSVALETPLEGPVKLHLASASGGWYVPSESLGVEHLLRPGETGGVPPASVSRITVAGHGEGLCLETRRGDAYRLSGNGSPGSVRVCPDNLGHDGLWQYDRLAGRLRIRAAVSAGGWARREMEGGRFTDRIAIGPPATGADAAGPYYLVPTRAGVLRLDGRESPTAIRTVQGSETLSPAAILLGADGKVVYATEEGVFSLDSGERVSSDDFWLPEGARVTALEDGPLSLVRLRWRRGDDTGRTLLREDGYGVAAHDGLLFSAATWSRFIRGRVAWGEPSPWLWLRLSPDKLQLEPTEATRSVDRPWTGRRPLAVLLRDKSLFLVENGEISEYRLDLEVERLFSD